jgi:hypothetical protein
MERSRPLGADRAATEVQGHERCALSEDRSEGPRTILADCCELAEVEARELGIVVVVGGRSKRPRALFPDVEVMARELGVVVKGRGAPTRLERKRR